MDRNAARHLVHNYGDRAHLVAAIADSGFNKPLHPKYQFIEAEVIYAIDFECAATAVDALARRTRLAFLDRDAAFEALPKVMMMMMMIVVVVVVISPAQTSATKSDSLFSALKVITLMSSKLGWDTARQQKEYDSAVSFLDTMHAWAYYKVCLVAPRRPPVSYFDDLSVCQTCNRLPLTLCRSSKTRTVVRAVHCPKTFRAATRCVFPLLCFI
jgi:hypothetical protein